jgi:hypothetical protein
MATGWKDALMADTGAPWNLPYPLPSDLVRDGADAIKDLAEATATGLSNIPNYVIEVKSAIFTGTQTVVLNAGLDAAVTNLSITHEVADASNRLIISAFLGAAANNANSGDGRVGLAIHDGTGLIGAGNADGNRARVTAGGSVTGSGTGGVVTMPSATFVHTPGAGSKTYTVRAVNISTLNGNTIQINRNEDDSNNANTPRSISSLIIMEIGP